MFRKFNLSHCILKSIACLGNETDEKRDILGHCGMSKEGEERVYALSV